MKSTPRRSHKNQVQKTARPSPKRNKPSAPASDHALVDPGTEAGVIRLNPQAKADALRDKRLVKDLQDNANRSDLTRHRREISATQEDNEVVDEEDEDLLRLEQQAEPASLSDDLDSSKNLDP